MSVIKDWCYDQLDQGQNVPINFGCKQLNDQTIHCPLISNMITRWRYILIIFSGQSQLNNIKYQDLVRVPYVPPSILLSITWNFINYAFYSVFELKRPKVKIKLFPIQTHWGGVHMEFFPKILTIYNKFTDVKLWWFNVYLVCSKASCSSYITTMQTKSYEWRKILVNIPA